MHFGIMDMQMNALIPHGRAPETLYAEIAGFSHARLVNNLVDQGFNPIELGGDLVLFFPHSYSRASVEGLNKLKEEKGVRFTVHLPLWSVEPSTPLAPVRHGSVRALVDCVRATLPLDPEQYVLHATGALAAEFYQMRIPEQARSLILRQFQVAARESLKILLAETGIPSRKLAIETIEFPFELTLQLAEELDLSMCLDVGHVLVGFPGPIELFEALDYCLPRLGEIHLHDGPWQGPGRNIGYGKDHQALGKGDLDVGRLLDRLAEVHWDGPVIFELSVEEALASLDVIRSLRPEMIS